MRKKTLAAAAALALLSVTPALAHTTPGGPWYAGLGLGTASVAMSQSYLDTVTNKIAAGLAPSGVTVTGSSESTSGAVPVSLFGGYRVNRYFSAELGYIHFGTLGAHYTLATTSGPLDVQATDAPQAIALTARGTLPLSRRWGLFARVGLAHYWETQAAVMTFLGTSQTQPTTSDSGLTGVFGLGASYRLARVTWRVGVTIYPSIAKGLASASGGIVEGGISGQYAF